MTQPVFDPNAQPPQARPRPPTLTHVIEHTEQTLRVVDENGVKSVQVTPRTAAWLLGQSVPGDDSTVIVAMFKTPEGGARVWVRPKDGTQHAQNHMAFLIELPPAALRFTMKTLHDSTLNAEIAADEQAFLFEEDDGGQSDIGDPNEPQEPATNGTAAIGQG